MVRRWSRKRLTFLAIGIVFGSPVLSILLLFAYFFAWFHAGALYLGDGDYRTGQGAATFQVSFTPVDPSRAGAQTFHFTRLGPSLSYAVGLRVVGPNLEPVATREDHVRDPPVGVDPETVVKIALTNERHETVFRYTRRLSEWDWFRDMAQIDGRTVEVPIGDDGSVRIDGLDVGPDGGWGTHFTPRWLGRYTLAVEIIKPSHGITYRLMPVIEGYTALP